MYRLKVVLLVAVTVASANKWQSNDVLEVDIPPLLKNILLGAADKSNDINSNSVILEPPTTEHLQLPTCVDYIDIGTHCVCNVGYKLHPSGKVCEPFCTYGCTNGFCSLPNICQCFPGYKMTSSNVCEPQCLNGCGKLQCIAPNLCDCLPGYSRSPLTNECLPLCDPVCMNGYCHKPNKCRCDLGYKKLDDTQECVPRCTGGCKNGVCSLPETCICKPGYRKDPTDPSGKKCVPKCEPACVNGLCVAPNECLCDEGFGKDMTVIAGNVCVRMKNTNYLK